MQEKCSKCDSEELFVEIQGNRRDAQPSFR